MGIKTKKPVNTKFDGLSRYFDIVKSGGEESRTPVQTYSAKAFYMLICLLIVGNKPENNKPICSLAGWS
jgi:hypothetical protein